MHCWPPLSLLSLQCWGSGDMFGLWKKRCKSAAVWPPTSQWRLRQLEPVGVLKQSTYFKVLLNTTFTWTVQTGPNNNTPPPYCFYFSHPHKKKKKDKAGVPNFFGSWTNELMPSCNPRHWMDSRWTYWVILNRENTRYFVFMIPLLLIASRPLRFFLRPLVLVLTLELGTTDVIRPVYLSEKLPKTLPSFLKQASSYNLSAIQHYTLHFFGTWEAVFTSRTVNSKAAHAPSTRKVCGY